MSKNLKIDIAQLNFTVGDINGNVKKILHHYLNSNADLVVFSELAITGYPPEDLVFHKSFQMKVNDAINEISDNLQKDKAIIFGTIHTEGNNIYNAAIFLYNNKKEIVIKSNLPNYAVFDEKRIFSIKDSNHIIDFKNKRLFITICEEIWEMDPVKNIDYVISINASPYEIGKTHKRFEACNKWHQKTKAPIIYLNQVGAQDELIFDGNSFIIDNEITRLASFKEEVFSFNGKHSISKDYLTNKYAKIFEALKLGLKDYLEKNNFKGVIIGLSGGIDSAICAAIAKEVTNDVRLYMLPSKFTSIESLDDAQDCAKLLGLDLKSIDIEPIIKQTNQSLANEFEGLGRDLTEENIQSRIRGNILMSLSNKFNLLLVTTGNKSEMAVGYATLYGDMCGGYNPIKDLYKTEVFELAKYINTQSKSIPVNIINKEPTAELRPDQKDSDSLPDYKTLDEILRLLIEEYKSPSEIIKLGYDTNTVQNTYNMLKRTEYKRFQAAPGAKITSVAFGKDRRYPLSNRFNDD